AYARVRKGTAGRRGARIRSRPEQLQAAVGDPSLKLRAEQLHDGRVRAGEKPVSVLLQRPVGKRLPSLHFGLARREHKLLDLINEVGAVLEVLQRALQRGGRSGLRVERDREPLLRELAGQV